jgi:hypothetical protein
VQFLEKNDYPEQNFSATSPNIPTEKQYEAIRIPLNQATENLLQLVNGPLQWLRTFFAYHHDLAAWQVALRFEFFTIVPLDRPMSVKEIAAAAKVDEDRLGRILKLLASQYCFQEVEEDIFAHTAMSALIAREKDIAAMLAMQ